MHGTATYKSMKFEAMNFRESLTAGLASVNGIAWTWLSQICFTLFPIQSL